MRPEAVARVLHTTTATVRSLCRSGALEGHHDGTDWTITPDALAVFIGLRLTPPPPNRNHLEVAP